MPPLLHRTLAMQAAEEGVSLERLVSAKLATGEYATESEVIRDGLRALMARDHAVEAWLAKEVVAVYDAVKASPSRAVSALEVRATLAERHKRATRTA